MGKDEVGNKIFVYKTVYDKLVERADKLNFKLTDYVSLLVQQVEKEILLQNQKS